MQGLKLGISKRELLQEYYPDELPAVLNAYCALHGAHGEAQEERVDVREFLSM